MIKIEDIIFWSLIIAIVSIALWLISGSPPEIDALITIALFVAASEMLIWRKIFSIEKNIAIGFMRVKHDMNKGFSDVNNRFNTINNKLDKIIENKK